MDPTPTTAIFAPARSIDDDTGPSIERHVGELVAGAASLVAEALREYQNGGLTTATKRRGDCIAHLYRLRQFMIADWPFDAIARTHGVAVLRETCGTDVEARTIDILVDGVLEILAKVVRKAVN